MSMIETIVVWLAVAGCILGMLRLRRAQIRLERMTDSYQRALKAYTEIIVKEIHADRWFDVFDQYHAIDERLKRELFPHGFPQRQEGDKP